MSRHPAAGYRPSHCGYLFWGEPMIPEDKQQKLKRLQKLATNGYDQNRQAEMRNGLVWAVKEIRDLDRVCLYQRRQNVRRL